MASPDGRPIPLPPEMRRHAPGRPLPPYRHRPGRTPHPRNHPQGHSHGSPEITSAAPLRPDNWPHHELYLYGVDLYNDGYWWEAHEYWEALWRLEEPDSPTRLLLQGLIQLAAALLKEEAGNEKGHAQLLAGGRDRLALVLQRVGPVYMGLDVAALLAGRGSAPALYLEDLSQSGRWPPA